ncbi:conserved hypothetical protein [Vibrio crassostreae]|uniref:hypothetical protein n=1 Tax=Vibrio crassostreae TaxID=246167 RepID=UPI001053A177|nr:hypothetical protein [Vibrio crassostreae]TCU01356.1 hypothetical protein EDB47_11827 [Vibrio crassostreae]CAK2344238.1 conserved hypothetical protein [Vibrio crassostreae]CAK2818222.1 conserved hypothetical protein [Vibrio crassostreae]CAK2902641.1 conserved hypothetical protein [Vibrio crassostreae]CAK3570576.1 conserved hypothetical protein [Vibrio crassostreae]
MFKDPIVLLMLISVGSILYMSGSLKLMFVVIALCASSYLLIAIIFSGVPSQALSRKKKQNIEN